MDNNYLQHYGVLGMKWGVRRSQNQLARTKKKVDKLKAKKKEIDRLDRTKKKLNKAKAEEKNLKDYLNKKKSTGKEKVESMVQPKKKTIKDLSDTELRERVARLELEKRYKDLAKQTNPPKSSKGHAFVSSVLEQSGKNIATQLTTYVMGRGVNKIFENVFNDPAIVNPKKGQKDK